jgi:hypothetical protein
MVVPLRSGRQNPTLGLGECRRHGRESSGVAARPLAPSPPQPRFGIEPAGQDPGRQSPQDDDSTARFAAECQSFLRASWMPGLITVWLPVRVLSAPTMQFCANPEFPVSAEYPRSITVWLPVRVLPAPPRSPALTPSSPSPRNTLDFPRFAAGVMARSRSLRETKTVRKRIGAFVSDVPKSVSRCAVKVPFAMAVGAPSHKRTRPCSLRPAAPCRGVIAHLRLLRTRKEIIQSRRRLGGCPLDGDTLG